MHQVHVIALYYSSLQSSGGQVLYSDNINTPNIPSGIIGEFNESPLYFA